MCLFGAIEAGGTKFNCLVGKGPQDIRAEARFMTTTPEETIQHVIRFFEAQSKSEKIQAMGIACFGPVSLAVNSPDYGNITTTPKAGWKNTPVVRMIQDVLKLPIAFDTDVNGAAIGEQRWGAAQGLDDFLYLTIGTGIGGGGLVNGKPIHGLVHPEMGHLRIPHDLQADPFAGVCAYHGDCFEGLASGPALRARLGFPAEQAPPDHPVWDLEARYISLALHNLICCYSPRRIILGGGVMQQLHLFPSIRNKVQESLNGYVAAPLIEQEIDQYIVYPGLGNKAGILGALAMAQQLLKD